jgi:hypothetical protein
MEMNDWWKAPVLQGPENDYGDYDYLIEEIPQSYARWELDRKYKWKCDDCGKDRHLLFRSAYYFHTLDGYDSCNYAECLHCRMKGSIRNIKWKIKKKIKDCIETVKLTIELYQCGKKSLKHCYKLAKKLVR